jgi:hypothetical protein
MTEALVITALVARRWRLTPEPEPAVAPDAGITLRPRNGVWVRLSTS